MRLAPSTPPRGGDPPSGPPSLVWADFDAPSKPPPAPAPSPHASPAIAPSPSEVSDPTSPVSSAVAPSSPPSATLPTAPPPPSAPITYHRRSNPPAPPPPPVPSSTQEPALPQLNKLITYQRRPIPPPKPPKPSPPATPAPPSSPVAHGTRSHGAAPPLALAIRCLVITPTPPARGDVPSTLLEDRHEELCDLHGVIPQLSHIFPDITESPSLNFLENPTIPIPLTVQEALSGPHAAEWRAAMEAECEAFIRNHSFDDEAPPPGVNIVGGKWLFRVKQLPDEAPVFKARYVAEGFTEQQYLDFFKTFSPTSKPPTVRTLLDVAARDDFEIKSMDASSAFLQGHLKETVFMDRPEGFPKEFPSNTAWKLNRPVYSLKQAPREWHNKVKEVISLDFHPSSADLTLFIRCHFEPFYILVYVDDFILVAKDSAQMTFVQKALSKALLMKDPWEQLNVEYVASGCNLADQFTKPLGKTTDPAAVAAAAAAAAAAGGTAAVSSRIAVGASVQAAWGVTAGTAAGGIRSSEWLEGVVDSVTTGGYVVRDAGGQMHEVRETRVRRVEESEEDARRRAQEALAAVEREADETRRALKRKLEEASRTELVKKEIPLKLRIKPEDSEDVVSAVQRGAEG
ncbi:unnamed protein product [Closterium sp. NIES-53]